VTAVIAPDGDASTRRGLVDLASRALDAQVIWASDELFADRRHLIDPAPAAWQRGTFTRDGKEYDGWETRRSRDRPGLTDIDQAIVRLGAPGRVRSVIVDTAHFTGNFPESASIEAVAVEGYPTVTELLDLSWTTLVPCSPLAGDAANPFQVGDPGVWTHVRLTIYPDGGVARLRVLGDVVPDRRFLRGTVDLAAMVNGATIADASNRFYSSPANLLLPGRHATIGEGWETARRRVPGNEWVIVRLAGAGDVDIVEIDTTHFTGNAPAAVRIQGASGAPGEGSHGSARWSQLTWRDLVARTGLLPDTPHRFLAVQLPEPVTHVRVDIYPDGGLGRVRLLGRLDQL